MKKDMPEEFRAVAACFYQGCFDHGETHEELVEGSVSGLDPRGLRVLEAYLDTLLSGEYGADELRRLWMTTPADVFFSAASDAATRTR